MIKSGLYLLLSACLMLAACIGPLASFYEIVTMKDGQKIEVHTRSVLQTSEGGGYLREKFVKMQDGVFIPCLDQDCAEIYELNKAEHPPTKRPEVEGD